MPSLPAPPAPRLLLGLLLLGSRPAGGTGPEPPALPIRSEKEPLPVRGAAGCSFGGKVYALDETWHPDLGEPFGVMRCVLCACEAPQWARRGRGPGRVSCKNIKPQCPTLACRQPRQLPGHCCQTCPQGRVEGSTLGSVGLGSPKRTGPPGTLVKRVVLLLTPGTERSTLDRQPAGLVFEYPRDPEHRSYSDGGEPGAGERTRADGHTDFVALLTGPRSQAVARARVSLQRSSLRFSISYQRLDRPSRVRFTDPTGNILFEHPAAPTQDGLVCGVWRAVPRLSLRLLRAEQLHVALVTATHPSGEVWGPLIWQGALAAETFSAILTLEDPQPRGVGSIALLTLSDTEDSLHFLLLFRGLLGPRDGALAGPAQIPLKLQIFHQGQPLRELQANTSAQEPGFAEVLPSLTEQEMDWLVRGELQMVLERAGGPELRISGYITTRRSCDVLQSVLCGADALVPVQTGAAGSASFILLGNGSLIYQVQVVGTGSEVVAMTLETKPQRKNQRTVLCHMAGLQLGGHMAVGICSDLGARGAHMLLQNELFLNIGTKDFPDGELRGHVTALPYSGHSAHYDRPQRLLKGFYGSEAQGVVKDLEPVLLRHLAQGTASLLITTKSSPRGELRGQVHITSHCEVAGLRLASEGRRLPVAPNGEAAALPVLPAGPGPEAPVPAKHGSPGRPRDPNTCFFEGQQRPHGARWSPNYDPLCSLCTCQRSNAAEIFLGYQTWSQERVSWVRGCEDPKKLLGYGKGTTECGATGEVHCEKVQCPRLACAQPVRANPTDCCKQCPVGSGSQAKVGDPMQADGPRGCRFAGQWFPENQSWHPSVPPFGEMSCITCRCGQPLRLEPFQSWTKKLKVPRECVQKAT
ncbi:hypothetical protein ACRRTK_018651 [Alexandromys fortis]